MVSIRCKLIVKDILTQLAVNYTAVNLGEVEIEDITPEKQQEVKIALLKFGLEVMEDKRAKLIEKIKTVIIEMVHYSDELPSTNYSDFLSEKLHYN